MKRTRAQKNETRLNDLAAVLAKQFNEGPTSVDLTHEEIMEHLRRALFKTNMCVRINQRSPRGKRGKEITVRHRLTPAGKPV